MQPAQLDPKPADDLWRARLRQQIDLRHPLVRLAGLIDWQGFEPRFGQLHHSQLGRPGVPIRLMVGLCYLQHTFQLSDQEVVERWVENPYWQAFCGFDDLRLMVPIDPSSLVRWRRRIGQDGMELLLRRRSPRRRRPGGQGAEPRARQHRHHGAAQGDRPPLGLAPLPSRPRDPGAPDQAPRRAVASELRPAWQAGAAARQPLRPRPSDEAGPARDQTPQDLPRAGVSDVRRKLESRPEVAGHFAEPLARVERLLAQQRTAKHKLYALHAPEVACIALARCAMGR